MWCSLVNACTSVQVINLKGEVVAMMAKKFEEHGLALPAGRVAAITAGLQEHQAWRPPVLGIDLEPAGSLARPAVAVRHVFADGAGAAAGVLAGDCLLAINGEHMQSVLEARAALGGLGGQGAAAGAKQHKVPVRVLLKRRGMAEPLELTVLAPPATGGTWHLATQVIVQHI